MKAVIRYWPPPPCPIAEYPFPLTAIQDMSSGRCPPFLHLTRAFQGIALCWSAMHPSGFESPGNPDMISHVECQPTGGNSGAGIRRYVDLLSAKIPLFTDGPVSNPSV